MKFKIRLKRRTNVYITMMACASGIWLLVARFGLEWQEVKSIFWICIALLLILVIVAVPVALLLRFVNARRDRNE